MIHRQVAALGASLLLAACGQWSGGNQSERAAGAASFPRADRPVAPIVSTRWSSEEARDRVNEAEDIMDRAGIRPGMTIADIGAGEGYYTVRLAKRVGARGRVLAEDILPEVIDALSRRITRENWTNVSVKLGAPEDPKLPENSFDRIFMVHMYHEIAEPYAFLWHLSPALKADGELIVVDADRPTWLDPYAAQGPEEFFPVAAEAFFVAPHGLALEFPEVYALMRDFFHQDPRLHAR